jgi:hypothetical protein
MIYCVTMLVCEWKSTFTMSIIRGSGVSPERNKFPLTQRNDG